MHRPSKRNRILSDMKDLPSCEGSGWLECCEFRTHLWVHTVVNNLREGVVFHCHERTQTIRWDGLLVFNSKTELRVLLFAQLERFAPGSNTNS